RPVSTSDSRPRSDAAEKPVESPSKETSVDASLSSPTLPLESSLESRPRIAPQDVPKTDTAATDNGDLAFDTEAPAHTGAEDESLPWENLIKPVRQTVSRPAAKPTTASKPAPRSPFAGRIMKSRTALIIAGCATGNLLLTVITWVAFSDHSPSNGKRPGI